MTDEEAEPVSGVPSDALIPTEVAEEPIDVSADPGRPDGVIEGQPGAMLIIISGPSGVGKDTIIDALKRRKHEPEYHYVVTCTTRAPRPGEVDGVDYHFLSREEFLRLRADRQLLEAAEVHGNWYGSPRDQVREAVSAGRDVILKIDVQGAQVVKEQISELPGLTAGPFRNDVSLPNAKGVRFEFSVQDPDVGELMVRAYLFRFGSDAYLVTFVAPAESFDAAEAVFEAIAQSLRFGV